MKKFLTTAIILMVLIFSSCTDNQRARNFGGTEILNLLPNEKLINITWKETNMWVLTEDTLSNIQYFRENSSYGIWQGEVIIKKAVGAKTTWK